MSRASLVLASASPRRQQLLAEAGYKFEVVASRSPELQRADFSLRELTTANATRKALGVRATAWRNAVVLAADTLVALDREIIGKPVDLEHAGQILRRLSARTHEVCTAVFIISPKGKFVSFAEFSRVRFRRLSARQIERYLRTVNPLDKAGAYAAQSEGAEIISGIDGSLTNVIGLPMERTVAALRAFGLGSAH